jgi:hypothetical protein
VGSRYGRDFQPTSLDSELLEKVRQNRQMEQVLNVHFGIFGARRAIGELWKTYG